MSDTEFKDTHKSLRQSIILAPPTTRKGVEKQMREDLYFEAAKTVNALGRVQGLRHLVTAMVRGEIPIPPGSRLAKDTALRRSLRDSL